MVTCLVTSQQFFIASVCIAIIRFENYFYLFGSHNRDKFGISTTNGFSTCMRFPNYESVVLHIQFDC